MSGSPTTTHPMVSMVTTQHTKWMERPVLCPVFCVACGVCVWYHLTSVCVFLFNLEPSMDPTELRTRLERYGDIAAMEPSSTKPTRVQFKRIEDAKVG